MREIALSKEFEQYNKEMANVNVYRDWETFYLFTLLSYYID